LDVQFIETAVAQPGGAPVTVLWDFGDGNEDNEPSPGHTYFTPGTFKAVLQVVDVHGFISTDSVVIKVEPEIQILGFGVITSDPSDPSPGQPVGFDFVFSGGNPPFSLLWEFGDGTSSALNPTFHTYTVVGEYHVLVRAVDANGQEVTGELSVTVAPTP
jgi:PKD repeat protein